MRGRTGEVNLCRGAATGKPDRLLGPLPQGNARVLANLEDAALLAHEVGQEQPPVRDEGQVKPRARL